jgi:predicted MFS family arabinose efflux permease
MTAGNEIVTLVFGLWMEQDFGLQITALGLVAVAIGLAELCAELLVGTWVDRLGKVRATALGLGLNALAAGSFLFVGHSSIGAVVVLLLFFLTFEFSLVSSLPMMTELIPAARASMMAVNNAMFALGRALGAALGGGLYALDISPLPSIAPNVLAAVMFNLLGLAALALLHRWWTGSPGKG